MKSRELLTLPEVQERLRVSRATIYKMFNDGQLRRVKVRDRTLVSAESVDAYLDKVFATDE